MPHVLGYEHTFINQAADIMLDLAGNKPVVPLPDFEDAYKTQEVLEAATTARAASAGEHRGVEYPCGSVLGRAV